MKKNKTTLKIILPVAVILLAVVAVSILVLTKPKPETKSITEKVWQVSVAKVKLGDNAPVLPLLGKVVSPSQVTLTAAFEADVLQVAVEEGQFVEKAAVLVVLDDREAKQRLLQREGELDEVQALLAAEDARFENDQAALKHEETLLDLSTKTVNRLRLLAQKDLGARSQLDEALQSQARQQLAVQNRRYQINEHEARLFQLEAKAKQMRARVALAKLELERTQVVAPVSGRVTLRHVAPGQRVKNGEALVTLYDASQLEIVAQLPWAKYAQLNPLLRKGEQVQARLLLGEDSGVPPLVRLDRIAAEVEASKGGVDAIFTLPGEAYDIPLGSLARVELLLPKVSQSLVLPYEALYGLDKVYRIVDDRLQAVTVSVRGEIGRASSARKVVIQSEHLVDGDQVLVTKFANAMDGLLVRVMP